MIYVDIPMLQIFIEITTITITRGVGIPIFNRQKSRVITANDFVPLEYCSLSVGTLRRQERYFKFLVISKTRLHA